MTDQDIINAFLAKELTTPLEKVLQSKSKELAGTLNTLAQELQTARQEVANKEADFTKLKHSLEAFYFLILAATK